MLDDETIMFTAMSVALDSLLKLIDQSPDRMELGYARAATVDAKKELDAYLEDHDMGHIHRADNIVSTAMKQMNRWKNA